MLEATFSPLIPTDLSESFYIEFYNQFCFIQVNDALETILQEYIAKDDFEKLLCAFNNF